ncbi:MAG: DNA-3-methyladenine glycosylase [Candidatus Zixiibacteriota bacterium]
MVARKSKKLPRLFYNRPTLEVARDLLGKVIVYNSSEGRLSARIVEVEAYIGQDDPACHAARGKTKRNAVMFGEPGHTYVYFIYGMYYCLNFVTEPENQAAAVLIRAAEPLEGIEIMEQNSPRSTEQLLLSGPGKFCRSFGLTREHNGLDLTGDIIYIEDHPDRPARIVTTPRIGINNARDKKWRFCDASSPALSRK